MFVVHFFFTSFGSSLSNKVDVNPGYGNGLFGNDLNDWKRLGTFAAIGNNPDPVTQNAPPETDGWGIVTVLSANNTKIAPTIQLFQPLNNIAGGVRPLFYRFFRDTWTEWKPIAIATPPQEYNLPLAAGVTSVGAGYKNIYSKDQFGIVRVWFSVHFETILTVNQSVFQLPVGFRPSAICCGSAHLSMGNYYPASINIDANGNGFVGRGNITQSGAINLHGFIEFSTTS